MRRFAEPLVAVHGGAGALEPGGPAPAEEAEARRALGEALGAAMARLREGGSALDAVVEAVAVLEDHPLFNAGRGSALTAKGRVEFRKPRILFPNRIPSPSGSYPLRKWI